MCACPDQLAECWLCEMFNPVTSFEVEKCQID